MLNGQYQRGDFVVLRSGLLKAAQPQGAGQVVAVLPETRGTVAYRVKFQNENFERNVSQDEVDGTASRRAQSENAKATDGSSSRWINASIIKIRK